MNSDFSIPSTTAEIVRIYHAIDETKLSREYFELAGKREGPYKRFYLSGELEYVANYIDDKLNGPSISYYQSGKVYKECNYQDDKLHGEFRSYYANGKLNIKCRYVNGKEEGEYITHYDSGTVKFEGHYKDAILVRGYTEYNPDGSVYIFNRP